MQLVVVDRMHPLRDRVEALIAGAYARCYGAIVRQFPDRLIVVQDANGELHCATGVRDAAAGFFSECYLDVPAEAAIANAAGIAVGRTDILELTTLGSVRPGTLPILLHGFARDGLAAGHRWGLFTATKRLRRFAIRSGIPYFDLGAAEPARIGDPAPWGSYYDEAPRVCAVDGHRIAAWLERPVAIAVYEDPAVAS